MSFSGMTVYSAVENFPYFAVTKDLKYNSTKYYQELIEIGNYYNDYEKGATFYPEGTKGDYVPSMIHFKIPSTLIDKQARFMFSNVPDINVISKHLDDDENEQIDIYNDVISQVLEKTNFGGNLLKAAKDCFIGKRVACVIDFSELSGVGIHFYNSMQFYYETEYGSDTLSKLITFEDVTQSKASDKDVFLVNRYERVGKNIYMSSILYDSTGAVVEELLSYGKIALSYIPGIVIFNDGILSQKKGVSDIAELTEKETGYDRIGNADIDSERQGMNPVTVFIDINHETTKDLSSSAGSVWDLEHNQLIDDPSPQAFKLSPSLQHSEPVKMTLDRLRSSMYETFDIPDITVDGMLSGVTSYKAVRALYFPLSVRCDEKLKAWKPALSFVFRTALDLCFLNDSLTKQIYEVNKFEKVSFKIEVVENYALLADETEEKQSDMEEVSLNVRSRFSYLKKWRGEELKTDEKIEEEIMRIAKEQNMMDTLSMNTSVQRALENQDADEEIEDDIKMSENGDLTEVP